MFLPLGTNITPSVDSWWLFPGGSQ